MEESSKHKRHANGHSGRGDAVKDIGHELLAGLGSGPLLVVWNLVREHGIEEIEKLGSALDRVGDL